MEKPKIIKIEKIQTEAESIKTIFFKHKINPLPGQFIMIWIPGIDEKPFAISYLKNDEIGITVAAVGPFSNKLSSLKPSDEIGIRGPYGNSFKLDNSQKNIVMIGGGYGSASLTLLAENAVKKGFEVKFILGARSKNKLVFADKIKKIIGQDNLIITTDDGSAGEKGFVTDSLKKLINQTKIDKIYACGPDKMLKAITEIGLENKINGEVSIERYMKCGYGLCGHCCVDPIGIRACVEGPSVTFEEAKKISELGKYHRLKSSRKEKL